MLIGVKQWKHLPDRMGAFSTALAVVFATSTTFSLAVLTISLDSTFFYVLVLEFRF